MQKHEWMAYIDKEVRTLCEAKGWKCQIRRKWSVRSKPVILSPISDYEWKLVPHPDRPDVREDDPNDLQGEYYVLWFDEPHGKFILQHDTHHCGLWGPHFEVTTYSEICPWWWGIDSDARRSTDMEYPPPGWLRDHLERLTAQFGPNHFSVT